MATIARFGVFELDLHSGELRKQGIKVRLQGKAFRLLEALLERPGDVVTREELQQRLWPAGVYVETESGLNTAANRLRLTLGDSPENPRYIETLARTGYRFIAPVDIVESDSPPASPAHERPRIVRRMVLVTAALGGVVLGVAATA